MRKRPTHERFAAVTALAEDPAKPGRWIATLSCGHTAAVRSPGQPDLQTLCCARCHPVRSPNKDREFRTGIKRLGPRNRNTPDR